MGVIIMTKMMVSSFRQVLASTFLKVLLLFLLSVPVFYLIVAAQLKGADYGLWYVGLRVLRFLLAGLLCWLIGRKNKGLFLQNPEPMQSPIYFSAYCGNSCLTGICFGVFFCAFPCCLRGTLAKSKPKYPSFVKFALCFHHNQGFGLLSRVVL